MMILDTTALLTQEVLLIMWPHKYVFDNRSYSMGSGPNWKQNMLTKSL